MIRKECPSYPVSIFMAGQMWEAQNICARFCDEIGLCVTLTRTDYIYTNGGEMGFIVGLINYPRFPAEPEQIWQHAEGLAEALRIGLRQDSYTIQAPDKTVWISHRAPEPL
jgi:hypothetical protein